ncbi:peptidylprolyl isomerase [bacterium]|nr:peptidylprolyl isomerase [bacterium]
MKRTCLILVAALAVMMIYTGCEKAPEDTVAKVGKYAISLEELNTVAGPMQARWKTVEEAIEGRKGAIDNLVQQKLLLLGAYKEGLDTDSALIARLDGNENRRKITALWEAEIASKINVTDEMVKDLYEKKGTEFSAAHILVKDEALAKEIEAKTKAGEDFAALAQQHSQDPGSAQKGGDLGWFTVGRMVKPFEDAVLALKDGEISAPIQTNYGFHIIKRIGTRTRSQEAFEKAEANLKATIEREMQGTKSLDFVNKMFTDRGFKLDEKAIAVVINKYMEVANQPEAPEVTFDDDEKAMVIATWDDGSWTIAQLDSAVKIRPAYQRQPLLSVVDVENFTKGNLQGDFLTALADKLNISNTDEYKEMFTKELEEIMVSTFQNQYIYGKVEVGDAEVQSYYEANTDSFMQPRTVVVIEVQVADEAEAKGVASKVKAGNDIAKFVEQKSMRTYTKNTGGVLEITERRFPNLYAAVGSAKVGDLVGPTKDRTNRWSVMKVTEIRETAVMPMDKVAGRIQSTLRRTLREKAMLDFVESANQEFGVKVFDKVIVASVDSSAYASVPVEPVNVKE